jgi:hypothetical protein
MNLNKIKGALAAALEAAPNKKQAARLMELNSPSLIGQQGPDLQEAADILSGKWNPAPVPVRVATDIPPRQPRAKPRTQEEMLEIVNRVGPQLQKQFVRKPDKTESVASKSKKRHDREAEYQHDIEAADQKLLPELDIADRLGTVDVSLAGDASRLGTLRGVNGLKLNRPVDLQAGPLFEKGWASGIDTASDYWKMMGRIQKQYGGLPVNAVYSNMASEGLPYAVHYEDALLSALNSAKVPKKNLDAFDQMMRNAFPNFVGVRNQDEAILQMMLDPKLRKHFAHLMELEGTTKNLGTPRGYDVKHAVEEPDLTTTEGGISGFVVKRPDLSLTHLPIETEHNTYGLRMPMETLGRQKLMLPKEVQFHDTLDSIMKNPLQANNALGTLHFGVGRQIIDQQQVDQVKMFEELMKKYYGMRKGGLATGGVPEKRDVSQLFPLKDSADNPSMLSELKNAYGKESKTYGDKGAAMDIFNRGFVTDVLGGAVDLANIPLQGIDWLASKIPALSEPASVMDMDSERVASFPISTDKPWGGKDAWNELFQKSGITSKTERPIAEMATSLIAPFAPAVAGKTAKLAAKGAKALAPTAAEMALDIASKYGVDPRMNIIKPKGGNWMAGAPETMTKSFKRAIPARMPMAQVNVEGVNVDQAVNNFIDKKLNKYIKNEMGSPEDSIRLGIERRALEAEKLREANEARVAKMEADIEKRKAAGKNTTLSENDLEIAKEKFADEYQIASTGLYHGTAPMGGWREEAVFEPQALGNMRKRAGFPEEGMATHPAAKNWEMASDQEIRPINLSSVLVPPDKRWGNVETDILKENPWIEKVVKENPEAIGYELDSVFPEVNLEFRHMIDELKEAMNPETILPSNLRITAKDLEKMSVDDVSALSGKISAWRGVQKNKADLQVANNPATHLFKEYTENNPKGVSWRQIKLPEGLPEDEARKAVKEATRYEGDMMRHCVGGAGHCEPLLNGDVEIYTLRDAKGVPHVTIEVEPVKKHPTKNDIPDDVLNDLTSRGYELGNKKADEMGRYMSGDERFLEQRIAIGRLIDDWLYDHPIIEKNILEIKGRKNLKPEDEYIPFVQDFVKSGKWSNIADLHHTDLYDVAHHSLKDFIPQSFDASASDRMVAIAAARRAGELRNGLMTREEWEPIVQKYLPQNKAQGGAVHMADGGVVNLDNLLSQAYARSAPLNLDDMVHQAMTKKFAEGGAAYNTTPDMADGGQFIQGQAF